MPRSSWLIATADFGGVGFDVEAPGGVEGVLSPTMPSGPLYIFDSNSARSYAAQIESAILAASATDITTCSITLQRNGYVRISFNTAVDVTWGGATGIRDALGFTGDLTGASTYTATERSTHIWIPGRTEISDQRLGQAGTPVYDTQTGGGVGSTPPVTIASGYREVSDLSWQAVSGEYVWVDGSPGELIAFWGVLMTQTSTRIAHYRNVLFDPDSTLSASLASRVGPYALRPQGQYRFPYRRSTRNVEQYADVELPLVVVSEI